MPENQIVIEVWYGGGTEKKEYFAEIRYLKENGIYYIEVIILDEIEPEADDIITDIQQSVKGWLRTVRECVFTISYI